MQVESTPQSGNSDLIVDYLQKIGLPVTRENYLAFAYPEGLPEDYGAENEEELPEELREEL